jgi:hypothetical protein
MSLPLTDRARRLTQPSAERAIPNYCIKILRFFIIGFRCAADLLTREPLWPKVSQRAHAGARHGAPPAAKLPANPQFAVAASGHPAT